MVGNTLGHYEILEPLGAGGMGEVYRARDTNLKREVAIKVLPEDLGGDADRLARLDREAHLLAALNHPNIATIHSLEEADGVRFLVLELIRGESLEAKIARGPLPLSEALDLARQVAKALEAAHGEGIIHRDLKPANVLVTPDDRAKVLDFGLAKTVNPQPDGVDMSQSPTATVADTQAGVILGTAPYMSPEQVRGMGVDERTDVWAFGCLLYEMLAGRRAFDRETVADTLAAILEGEPRWEALQAGLPAVILPLLQGCLRKDPERRVRDMAGARIEFEEAVGSITSGGGIVTGLGSDAKDGPRPGPMPWVTGAVALAALVVAAVWLAGRISEPDAESAPPAELSAMTFDGGRKGRPALSSDGQEVAFAWLAPGTDNRDVYVKQVGIDSSPVPVTDDPSSDRSPEWSADGNHLAFVRLNDEGASIYRVPKLGGNESRLIDVAHPAPNANHFTLSWSADGRFLAFAESTSNEEPGHISVLDLTEQPLTPRAITEAPSFIALDTEQSGDRHPSFASDSRRVAFLRSNASYGGCDVWLTDIQGTEPQRVTSESWVTCNSLDWVPNQEELLVTAGSPQCLYTYRVAVGSGEARFVEGMAVNDVFATARNGRLVFVKAALGTRDILRVPGRLAEDLGAGIRPAVATFAPDMNHNVSGDGRVAFESCLSGRNQIWIANLDGSDLRRVTDMSTNASAPNWSNDGRLISFDSSETGNNDVWVVEVDSGRVHQVTTHEGQDLFGTFSPDDRLLYFMSDRTGEATEIFEIPVEGETNGGEAVQITQGGGSFGFVDSNNEYLYYADKGTAPSIWRVPLAGGEPDLMVANGPSYSPMWHLTPGGIYYQARDPDGRGWGIDFLNVETRDVTEIHRDGEHFIWLRVTPDERDVTFTRDVGRDSWNLWLIENFR